jgi:TRAP-type C4-dicarboxylate transport system permease small subunit
MPFVYEHPRASARRAELVRARLKKWHDWVDSSFATISAVMILFLMLITTVDSFGRSFFNHPFVGVFEVSRFAMAWIGFLALGYVQMRRAHITINLIKGWLKPKAEAVIDFFMMCLSLGTTLMLGWVGLDDALEAIRFGDKVMSGLLTIPIGPPKLIIPFGCVLLSLRFISQMVDDVLALFGKGPVEPHVSAENEGDTI